MNTREFTDKFGSYQKQVSGTAQNLSTAADRYVRENTWMSIGIAALLGCVVGYLLANSAKEEESEDSEEKSMAA